MKFLLTIAALVAVVTTLPTRRPSSIADSFEPIAAGPAIVDFPVPPSPVVIDPLAPNKPIPLVQIIVNVKDGSSAPVVMPSEEIKPNPVIVVEQSSVVPEPIQIDDVIPVEPANTGTPIILDEAVAAISPNCPNDSFIVVSPTYPDGSFIIISPSCPDDSVISVTPSYPDDSIIVVRPSNPDASVIDDSPSNPDEFAIFGTSKIPNPALFLPETLV